MKRSDPTPMAPPSLLRKKALPLAPPSSRGRADDAAIHVRRIHRRDLLKTWEFLKLCFRGVNRETVEYQRPRSKKRFFEVYEEEGIVQLLFELTDPTKAGTAMTIVGYAECAFEISGTDNWMNHRYFSNRDMKPLFVEEIAVHPGHQGLGIGSFVLEQMEHIAKLAGCTHLVLEVAENNENALRFYRGRSFQKLDAAVFLAKRVAMESDILPPRKVVRKPRPSTPSVSESSPPKAPKKPRPKVRA